ncbi:sensor histidine kinase [Lactobacillus equicursoris]|uniref:sensor histidine kinase n=1 Tax=Lactobacillus equicursoris TaxID=420645 RepID=UPI0039910EF9
MTLFLQILVMIFSAVVDIWLFCLLAQIRPSKLDWLLLLALEAVLSVALSNFQTYSSLIYETGLEILLFCGYFYLLKKADHFRQLLGAGLLYGIISLIIQLGMKVLVSLLPLPNYFYFDAFMNLLLPLVVLALVIWQRQRITNLLTDANSSILVSLLAYLYFVCCAIGAYILDDKKPTEVVLLFFFLLIFQAIFLAVIYREIVHIQRQLLDQQKQEALARQKQQLIKENEQLKEYAAYLDQNEDELRRFKHDYQNILLSLKVSAEKGGSQALIAELEKYTSSQFDQKALRKYPDVNHIKIPELKSIAIAKLAKLYNDQIDYSFGCESEISQIPQTNLLDLVRIIGIAFDNAIEASQQLKERGGKGRVEAMYYQEGGDFEFMIRNRIDKSASDPDQLAQAGYTTKKDHAGLGLANVKELVRRNDEQMLLDYGPEDGWFNFSLTLLPENVEEEA